MRLFHVSEEPNISIFEPRSPERDDLDKNNKLVWTISEDRTMNYLTPRDCPRVTFYADKNSNKIDIERFMGTGKINAVIAIEQNWFHKMLDTSLYIYEFNTNNFTLQDETAGYYVSSKPELPINVRRVDDIFSELFKYNVELRVLPNLWGLSDAVSGSSLGFSICRMRNALPRE
jgi:hypothetical protein